MKNIRSLIVVVLSTSSSIAYSQEIPPIKKGLWENVVIDGGNTTKSKFCVGDETLKDLLDKTQKMMGECNNSSFKTIGSKYHYTVNCDIGVAKINSSSEVYGDFSKRYEAITTSTTTPPLYGLSKSTSKSVSSYIGPCEAGMKPGDMIMEDGKKVNINEILNSTPNTNDAMKLLQGTDPKQLEQMQKQMQEMMKNMPK